MANREFTTVNISDCLEDKIEGFGEADLKRAVSTFSSIDRGMESFLKNSAEDFARQRFTAASCQLPAASFQLSASN